MCRGYEELCTIPVFCSIHTPTPSTVPLRQLSSQGSWSSVAAVISTPASHGADFTIASSLAVERLVLICASMALVSASGMSARSVLKPFTVCFARRMTSRAYKFGGYAARASSCWTGKMGYQRRNTLANSWFRVLTRIWSSRCAARFIHCICYFLQKRLLII
jgi:hypothetical protein